MDCNKKIVSVILARGGSKGIPNKNIIDINLNDNTNAGIECKEKDAFSVQYHPESSPGPHDSRYLFNKFIELMNA